MKKNLVLEQDVGDLSELLPHGGVESCPLTLPGPHHVVGVGPGLEEHPDKVQMTSMNCQVEGAHSLGILMIKASSGL